MSGPVTWILVHRLDGGGVPAVLVRYLRWLRSPAGPSGPDRPAVHVVAGAGGRWAAEVERLADSCTLLGPEAGRSAATTVAVAAAQLGHPAPGAAVRDRWARHRLRPLPRPDVVLVHGAGGWPLWRSLAPSAGACRLVVHLHELTVAIHRSVPPDELGPLVAEPDVLAAVCPPDAGLTAMLGGRAAELAIVPGCVDGAPPPAGEATTPSVVAIGEAGWRKGADRFEALAHELARRRPEVRCRWIGAPPPPGWALAPSAPSPVRWEGPVEDPWSRLEPGAVVVVPSREDPLPLVALEAGARGLPVVASGVGGLGALLHDGRGWWTASADVRALVDLVVEAVDDRRAAAQRGAALRAEVEAHLTAAHVGPRWWALVAGAPST